MPLYLPDFSEIMAVAETRGADSDAPHLWNGLVGAWPLQETGGVTAFDVSNAGYPFSGTLMGGASRRISTVGRRVYFDGFNDYISVAGHSRLNFGVNDFSLACCAAPIGTGSPTDCIIGKTAFAGNSEAEYHIGTIGGKLWGAIRDGSGADGRMDADAAYTLGQWYHACIVRRAGACTFFVDARSQADTATISGSVSSTNAFQFGNPSGGASWFQGYVSNAIAYSRALTPAEIQQLYADQWAMYRLRTVVHPVAVAEPSGFKPYWARNVNTLIGGGV